jgi:hypothetical protein
LKIAGQVYLGWHEIRVGWWQPLAIWVSNMILVLALASPSSANYQTVMSILCAMQVNHGLEDTLRLPFSDKGGYPMIEEFIHIKLPQAPRYLDI